MIKGYISDTLRLNKPKRKSIEKLIREARNEKFGAERTNHLFYESVKAFHELVKEHENIDIEHRVKLYAERARLDQAEIISGKNIYLAPYLMWLCKYDDMRAREAYQILELDYRPDQESASEALSATPSSTIFTRLNNFKIPIIFISLPLITFLSISYMYFYPASQDKVILVQNPFGSGQIAYITTGGEAKSRAELETALAVADMSTFRSLASGIKQQLEDSVGAMTRAERSKLFVQLGNLESFFDLAAAVGSFKLAVELNEKSPLALYGLANSLLAVGRPDDAVLLLEDARIQSANLDDASKAEITAMKAMLDFASSRNSPRFEAEMSEALELAQDSGDRVTRTLIALRYIHALIAGESASSEILATHRQLFGDCDQISPARLKGLCFDSLAHIYRKGDNFEKYIDFSDIAISLFKDSNATYDAIRAENNQYEIILEMKRRDVAFKILIENLRLSRATGFLTGEIQALQNLAHMALEHSGDPATSLGYAEEAIERAKLHPDVSLLGDMYERAALAIRALNNGQSEIPYLLSALEVAQKLNQNVRVFRRALRLWEIVKDDNEKAELAKLVGSVVASEIHMNQLQIMLKKLADSSFSLNIDQMKEIQSDIQGHEDIATRINILNLLTVLAAGALDNAENNEDFVRSVSEFRISLATAYLTASNQTGEFWRIQSALEGLAHLLVEAGRMKEALNTYQRALEIRHDESIPHTLTSLFPVVMAAYSVRELDLLSELISIAVKISDIDSFSMNEISNLIYISSASYKAGFLEPARVLRSRVVAAFQSSGESYSIVPLEQIVLNAALDRDIETLNKILIMVKSRENEEIENCLWCEKFFMLMKNNGLD